MYQGTYIHRSYELAAAMKRRGEVGGSLQGLGPFIGREFRCTCMVLRTPYISGPLFGPLFGLVVGCLGVWGRDLVPFTVALGFCPRTPYPGWLPRGLGLVIGM